MLTKQRLGEAADMLEMKFSFEKNVEFQGHKEEAVRELYNWCRDQERKPAITPAKTLTDCGEIAGRVFCDPALAGFVMNVDVGIEIAKLLYSRVVAPPPTVPSEAGGTAPQTASQCPEASPAAASPPA